MFNVNSRAMKNPRERWPDVSALHTGTMTFKCPVPMPLIIRAQIIQVEFWEAHW